MSEDAPRKSVLGLVVDPANRRSLLLAGTGAIVGLLIAGFGLFTAQGTRTGRIPAEDVAIVNNSPILMADYIAQLRAVDDLAPSQATPEQKRRVLDSMIMDELYVQRGLELGLANDDIDVRAALVRGTEAQTTADAMSSAPNEKELHDWFVNHPAAYAGEATIQVENYKLPPAKVAEAAQIVAALRSGQAPATLGISDAGDFADGPQFLSIARLRLTPRLFTAALPLKVGGVSDPVAMPDGVHILRMVARTAPLPDTFEEARAKVIRDWSEDRARVMKVNTDRFLRNRADIRTALP